MARSTAQFDALAAGYDAAFTDRLPALWLRDAVRERVEPYLQPGMDVVELGCGSGTDSVWLARHGCRVWALDASPGMLEQARVKVSAAGQQHAVSLNRVDIEQWRVQDLPPQFNARLVFSNFGVLNCVTDLERVFTTAWQCLDDNGHLAVILMGRFCLAETLYFGCRGQFRKATRRWHGSSDFGASEKRFKVYYYSLSQLRRAARGFRAIGAFGIGGLLPPTEGYDICERWPRTFRRAAAVDRRMGRILTRISDHYMAVFAKEEPTE